MPRTTGANGRSPANIVNMNQNTPPRLRNRTEAIVQSDPLLRKSFRVLQKMVRPRTFRGMMDGFERLLPNRFGTRTNKVLRVLLNVFFCFFFFMTYSFFDKQEAGLSKETAVGHLVFFIKHINKILGSTFGSLLRTNFTLVTVGIAMRYGPSMYALRSAYPVKITKKSVALQAAVGVGIREGVGKLFPWLGYTHKTAEILAKELFKLSMDIVEEGSKKLATDKALGAKILAALRGAQLLSTRDPGRDLVNLMAQWLTALMWFSAGLFIQSAARGGYQALEMLMDDTLGAMVHIRRLPGVSTLMRRLGSDPQGVRQMVEGEPSAQLLERVGEDVLMLPAPPGSSKRKRSSPSQGGRKRTTRAGGRGSSPRVSNDEAKRFIQSRGGSLVFQSGPRKGQAKNSAALRREMTKLRGK